MNDKIRHLPFGQVPDFYSSYFSSMFYLRLELENLCACHAARFFNYIYGHVKCKQRACHIQHALTPTLTPTFFEPLTMSLTATK